MSARKKSAFTLVELSIVLVIIGLLIGAVLIGRDLIYASEVRSIVSDWEKFETARMTFKTKYDCTPGDCANASAFSLGVNGNGSGYVDWPSTSNVEHWEFWKQLANAGLIPGNYTGLNGPASGVRDAIIGTNIPASRMSGVGHMVWSTAPQYAPFPINLGQTRPLSDSRYITGRDESVDNNLVSALFSPMETQALDAKYDDGIANKGNIRVEADTANYKSVGCVTGSNPNYNYINSTTGKCQLSFWWRNN